MNASALAAAAWMWLAAGAAQPNLLKNGGFESVRPVKGAASGDVGFGRWTVSGPKKKPDGWLLNSAYPGDLAVLPEAAHSGRLGLRIRGAAAKRPAHVFQPCPGVRAGKWYRVSAWVRGRASLCFYEYYEKGPIRAPTVCAGASRPGQWRQLFGYYAPGGAGFKAASLAIVVNRGDQADIDDVRIEPLPEPAIPADAQPLVFQNDRARLVFSPRGALQELRLLPAGENYAAPGAAAPVFHAQIEGASLPGIFLRRDGDVIQVGFANPQAKVRLRVVARPRYFLFELVDAQPKDMEWFRMELPLKRLATQGPAFAANYDDRFAACLFSLNLPVRSFLRPRGGDVMSVAALWVGRLGLRGARAALAACPRKEFSEAIQQVERDNGLPCPMLDGRWARESDPVRRSYLFVIGMAEKDTDALIRYAKIGGFQTILILKNAWLKTHGHYQINTRYFPDGLRSLQRVADKIHAAGLKVGVHVFGPSVSPNDPYVTPKPDDRLFYVSCPPLAQAVDARAQTLTLAGPADNLPPARPRSRGFPGYYLRIGDEIIRYSDVSPGPPFRFVGCRRGACGTIAAPHPAGAAVRGMLAMWGFFMVDPDSSLLDEITSNFARIVNTCRLDMVYFDASDGGRGGYLDVRYYLDKCHLAFYRKFDHDVLYQTSTGPGYNLMWHIVPRSASADGHGDIKAYLDQRLPSILRMRDNFIHADVGWYGLDPGSRADRLEYICAKCLGVDGSISVQANRRILETHPHARQILEMIARYERCRLAGYFPASVKAELVKKGAEFKLFDDGKGGWMLWHAAYEPDRVITRLDGKQNAWSVNNPLARPCRLAVEITRGARYAAGPDYDSPRAKLLADFEDLAPYKMSERNQYEKYVVGGGKVLTPNGPARKGVTLRFIRRVGDARVGRACVEYEAVNRSAELGWCGVGKRFPKPLDLSGCRSLALWVFGDARNEVLMLQFRDAAGRWFNCRKKIGFRGWRLLAFPLAKNASIDWRRIEYLIFYYNNLPANTTVRCRLDGVKALPGLHTPPALAQLELTVNGRPMRLPGALKQGETLTTDGQGGCAVWPGGMAPARRFQDAAYAPRLQPGRNAIRFSCRLPAGFQPDVTIRLIRLWPVAK